MLKYIDKAPKPAPVPQQLNDIPEGTVFYGTVEITLPELKSALITGVWIKTYTDISRHNVHAVCLALTRSVNGIIPDSDPSPRIAVRCERVTDYRPMPTARIVED